MSKRYLHRDQLDSNHTEICDEIRRRGFEVIETFRPVDILIYKNGWTGWCELKADDRKAEIKTSQLMFMAFSKMPVCFARNAAEVLWFAKSGEGLSERQKTNIALALAAEPKRTRWTPAMVAKILEK